MHFYIDRTASEAFLGSAIRQQSVLYIANTRSRAGQDRTPDFPVPNRVLFR